MRREARPIRGDGGDRSMISATETTDTPGPAAVAEALAQVVASPAFDRADRLKALLTYVVEETMAGRGERLKGYTLGVEVFGRDESFDPQADTIVRVEMGRLRRKLADYYDADGRDAAVRIVIPKGRYRPDFRPATNSPTGRTAVFGRRRRWLTVAGALSVVALGLAVWLTVDRLATDSRPGAGDRGIAVLPFVNLSGQPDIEVFGDGLTERIIAGLSQFNDLDVVARHSSFGYKGLSPDVRNVGRELGVRFVVEGSVRRAGEQVRVTAQLIDARDGTHLWSAEYERALNLESLVEVQDALTEKLVSTIGTSQGAITRAELARLRAIGTDSFDAYGCTLRTTYYYRVLTPDLHAALRDCLERAIADDPDYLRALAALGLLYLDEYRFAFNPRPDPLDRAEQVARRALGLDPGYQFARSVLAKALFFRGEFDRFLAEADRTIELNPNNSEVLASLGRLMIYSGRRERGTALVKRAMEINLHHPDWYRFPLAYAHYFAGEHDAALAQAMQIDMPDFWGTHEALALIHGQRGDPDRAAAARDRLIALRPDYPEAALARWRANQLAEADIAKIADGLRRAGIVE